MDEKAPDLPKGPLTAEEFLAWQESREFEGRFELLLGEIVTMQAERTQHSAAKTSLIGQLFSQLGMTGECKPYSDGMAVRVPSGDVYEPDAMVRCGDPLGPETICIHDPTIVVEITSPSNSRIEMSRKRARYLEAPSVEHVVLVVLKDRMVFHDERGPAPDKILTTIHRGGSLKLTPPGVMLDLDALFEAVDAA